MWLGEHDQHQTVEIMRENTIDQIICEVSFISFSDVQVMIIKRIIRNTSGDAIMAR